MRTIVASPREPQLVVPFSTSPFTAKLFAGNELTALELEERTLLEETTADDGAEELGTEEGVTEELLDVVTTDDELGRLLLDGTCELEAPTMPKGAG